MRDPSVTPSSGSCARVIATIILIFLDRYAQILKRIFFNNSTIFQVILTRIWSAVGLIRIEYFFVLFSFSHSVWGWPLLTVRVGGARQSVIEDTPLRTLESVGNQPEPRVPRRLTHSFQKVSTSALSIEPPAGSFFMSTGLYKVCLRVLIGLASLIQVR